MRRAPLLAALVVGLAFAAPGAQAQQASALILRLAPQEDALTADHRSVTISGTATLITDTSAHSSPNGIPVEYHVTKQPAWATVVVSPASDVFPTPATPGLVSYSVTRAFTVDVHVDASQTATSVDVIEMAAFTTPSMGGKAVAGKVAVPLVFLGEDSVCDTDNPLAGLDEPEPEAGLTVQGGGGMPLGTPWLAVGGFGLVGAGAGLLLRRRL